MSDFDFKAKRKTGRNKGKVVTGTAYDDHFGRHKYGYLIHGAKNCIAQETFNRRYEMLEEPADQQGAANALDAFFNAEEPKEETLKDVQAREFIITDSCAWEANRQSGAYHPHSIEVVDTVTGQIRHIASGAKIKFVEGGITQSRTQAEYNHMHND